MKTILLVDDDVQVRAMFGMTLRRAGYHVLEADSGDAGLQMARQHLPDVILSDIHMPGGDGSSLLRAIRKDPALQSKQVVLMTGRPDLVTPRSGMEDGADDFLVKPVSLKALLSCIAARLNRATVNWRVEDQTIVKLQSLVPSNLPHEFFTPLAGIIGLVEILRSGGAAALSPTEVGDIYNDIYFSAHRLHRTLRNYLLILDLETTPTVPVPQLSATEVEASIRDGIEEAVKLNERKADITCQLAPCSLCIRPEDLARIIDELVDNACKFSRPGTPVEVKLSEKGILTITDKGRGMTPEDIKRIGAFQQFERKKNEQQGLGLGLVLSQKLAALVKAEVTINSQPGAGTEVQVAFPVGAA